MKPAYQAARDGVEAKEAHQEKGLDQFKRLHLV